MIMILRSSLGIILFFSLLSCIYFYSFDWVGASQDCAQPNPNFNHVQLAKILDNRVGRIDRLAWDDIYGPKNHAYKKLAYSSEVEAYHGIHGAFRATDGDVEGAMALTREIEGAFLDIDLDSPVSIRCVRVWNRKDDYMSRIVPFFIFLSNVSFSPSMLASEAQQIAIQSIKFSVAQPKYIWKLPEAITARYVRIQLVNTNILHIYELEVFDTYVSEEYRFVPRYIPEKIPPPIITLPPSFKDFRIITGKILNVDITKDTRVFSSKGQEIDSKKYENILLTPDYQEEFYISQGEDFIGEVKVCVVFLCTDGHGFNTNDEYLLEISRNLELLSANVFQIQQYTVIIFHSWRPEMVKLNIQRFTTSFPHLRIKFVNVSEHFPPTLPKHLIDNNVDMTLYENGTDCAPSNKWRLNYLHMGRFWSTQIWKYPILKEFDLIWRLDADATVDSPMKKENTNNRNINFLRDMWAKKKLFGYYSRLPDYPECDSGVLEATEEFARRKGLTFRHKDKIESDITYWGGFGVYATQFFCEDSNWLDYVDYLDSLGGHYNHRWGEQNIFPSSLSLFLNFHDLYWVRNFQVNIFHDHDFIDNVSGVSDSDIKYIT